MIVDSQYIKEFITTDGGERPVPYRWSHGATENHLGDGLVIYALIQHLRSKNCVCLGSGGGFIPRIMTQARMDLYEQGIFEDPDMSWGESGCTYVVDAANEVGGHVFWAEKDSFFRSHFYPRFIKDTTENAFYNFFVKQDIQIDFLHIDAGHSFEDVKRDFELYSQLVRPGGIISIHDTDGKFSENLIVSEDNKETFDDFSGPSKFVKTLGNSWAVINLFNEGVVKNKPSSTGLTLIQKKTPMLNLVTVVGDFHHPLTLVQMLKHYEQEVDREYVVYYETEDKEEGKEYRTLDEFKQYLLEQGLGYVEVLRHKGPKYDWDNVTRLYNLVTTTVGGPDDWWIISDSDELQQWPERPRGIMKKCIEQKKTFVRGAFLDRIGEGGTFPEISGPEVELDKLFPLVGFFRYPMSGACANKVVMVKSGQKVTSGQHYARFEDVGDEEEGRLRWANAYPVDGCFVQVHHFKWDSTVLDRLRETAESHCRYSEEFHKMRQEILNNSEKIPLLREYYIEDYDPKEKYKSFSKWEQVKQLIKDK